MLEWNTLERRTRGHASFDSVLSHLALRQQSQDVTDWLNTTSLQRVYRIEGPCWAVRAIGSSAFLLERREEIPR